MKYPRAAIAWRLLPVALAAQAAFAQQAPAPEATESAEKPQEVVITGTASSGRQTLKKDSTNTINTLSAEEIRRLAPISTADLLQNVPGIFAEGSTAGEASNNITVRGLPVTGGYRYAPQLIDGLPWFEEPEVPFMNNDVAVRDDLMTKRVEVVKGGTGGILYSNGLGATVNHITRTGSQQFEGGYKLEVADYNFVRNDLFVSGPISKNLTFAVGGFYRTSDGLRNTGYTADKGGQVRGNLVYQTDDGRSEVQLHALKINDRTAFYQNVPFQVPAISAPGTPADPVKIRMDQVWPLGIDFAHGTVASSSNRRFRMLGEYGERQIDTADGIHPDFNITTLKGIHEFESGWTLDAGLRHSNGSSGFNGMFTGNDTTTAARFNNARFNNDVLRFGSFYPTAVGVAAYGVDGGARIADSAYLNYLIPFIARTEARSTSFDLKLGKSVQWLGEHQLTLGAYATNYANRQNFQQSLLVSTMEAHPQLVDLRAIDAAGNPVGPSVTSNGVMRLGFNGYLADAKVKGEALYFLDHWETGDGRLKIDAGVRHQTQRANVIYNVRDQTRDLTPAGVLPGSTADTLADNEILLPGADQRLDSKLSATGWSLGSNYSVQPNLAVYGLVSRSFRLPSLEQLNQLQFDPSQPGSKVERIMQYEGGLRYYAKTWDTQLALFYNKFSPRDQYVDFRDFTSPSCTPAGVTVDINSCPLVREFYRRGIENVGLELEAAWRPSEVKGLELRFNGLVQDPKVVDANYRTVKELRVNDVVTGYTFEQIGEDGRRPRRLAAVMANLQASWDLKPYTGLPLKPYAKYTYFGSRYSESQDVNVTLYPAYYHLDGGFIWDFSQKSSIQFHVSNITNRLSFTEGDPVFVDLKGPNGATNRGVSRPLFGRTLRAMYTYFF
ncbi:TonB-dependent receptor [Ideonella azotifigens]|uniref:TonB-dependent receptor n=1 Tax=Ideonella azotifigens TaxID=513160 RepID=A0ABP3VE94_9BURK|nr:TonB-dependent receptor [Ideonella azotifigens]MCD2344439.1 TonB-dependent receptor [Ideonella azotifigens]